MKLELKHLTPYLPYDLNVGVLTKWDSFMKPIIGKACELSYKSNHGDWVKVHFGDCHNVTYNTWEQRFSNFHTYFFEEDIIKPILTPLSKLNFDQQKEVIKHLFRDSGMMKPGLRKDNVSQSIKCEGGFITFYDHYTNQRYTAVKPSGRDNLPVLNMSNDFTDYEVFFKLHVDMFGLIEKGLAIDKTGKELTTI